MTLWIECPGCGHIDHVESDEDDGHCSRCGAGR
jgi:DNA-directed RNA polymerase subunit RPC12/RpoP